MKSYTDLEQSKKLAEFLPVESADMYWENGVSDKYIQCFTPFVGTDRDYDYDVPCWSLAALIEALPLGLEIHDISDGHKIYYYVEMYTKEIYTKLKRMNKAEICLSTERHENLVDCCFEMILKLKEKDLL